MVRSIRVCLVVVCLWQGFVFGQQSAVYTSDVNHYRLGLELFQKGKFVSAQKHFEKASAQEISDESEIKVNSEYYAAICALELFNKDAEHLLVGFVEDYPESPRVRTAYFQLGKYSYRKKRWEKVIYWFNKVDMFDLTKDEVAEYHFKQGYSHFMTGEYEEASKILFEIKDVDTKYTAPARYYYGHISYEKGDHQTALQEFEKLKTHDKFSQIVPYYITQIYYQQKKYEDLIAYAPALLDSATPKRAPEISRLIGDAYYKTEKYEQSIPYLEKYKSSNYNLPQEDKYQLGYAYYKSGKYDKAISIFTKVNNSEDSLAQTAYYHLGDCYLKTENKKFARSAYQSAYELDFDKEIKEDALYNYAVLSYELSYDPYNKSIDAFKQFIEDYPNSEKTELAYEYLLNVYLTTNNYAAAMASIETINSPDERIKQAYQRVAYNSAVEMYHNNDFKAAITQFKKVDKYPVDRHLNAMSLYWMAECYYHLKKLDKSLDYYKSFVYEPGAILEKEFNRANYNIAYINFDKEEHQSAINFFRKFINYKGESDTLLLTDANLRIGDSYFLLNDYYRAEGFYQTAIDLKGMDTDYAIYQRAMALGILKRPDEKMGALKGLLKNHPKSNYLVDAKYQLGKGYLFLDSTKTALSYFDDVIANYPNSSYVKKSLLNKGLIHFNKGENELALNVFKKIVKNYPTYEDSKEALIPIKNIYVKLGRVDEYAAFMGELSFVNVTNAELDSVTYEAAELQYMDGNCETASAEFNKYLKKFEHPVFELNARYYAGECAMKAEDYSKALDHFNKVINKPLNKFTESALVKASKINFGSHNFKEALNNYMMLENVAEYKSNVMDARVGQMKCFFFTKNYDEAIKYSKLVLEGEKLTRNNEVEAKLTIARSLQAQDSLMQAYDWFSKVVAVSQSEMGAESKYQMAKIQFDIDSLKLAEKEVYELVNLTPSYAFWVAKGLILLADIYVQTDDYFQAEATLQSILDNYSGKDNLKELVAAKLAEVKKLNQPEVGEEPEDELEIDFGSEEELDELNDLFEEDELEENEPVNKKQ